MNKLVGAVAAAGLLGFHATAFAEEAEVRAVEQANEHGEWP